uniref:Transcription initiation factor TFIID subunit 12 n=1 Tax=Takifugu rubripes TaxID=31033 RepID=A0A3B5KI04_TAKRU
TKGALIIKEINQNTFAAILWTPPPPPRPRNRWESLAPVLDSGEIQNTKSPKYFPRSYFTHKHLFFKVLTKKKLQDLVREIDPNEQLDEDVEEMLLQIADDFIESVVTAACQLARHRKSNTLEVKDVQLHLERQWNMWIPGFGSDEIRPFKKACTTEAHKQRMALIRKTTKK